MIDIDTVDFFWYDGVYPMATLKDGSNVSLSEADARRILDRCEQLAADATVFTA